MPSITRLVARNFCCIKELDLNLQDLGLVQIVGENLDSDAAISNGSGKSSIFKAITWCLYHDTLDKDKYDEVIRYGAKSAYVEVYLQDGKNEWVVKRERLNKRPLFGLWKNGVEWQDEPQNKVIDLLGLDFNGFCNSILYGQEGNITRFFSATDTQRKEMLHRILRTEIYRRAEKEARRLYNEKQKEFDEANTAIDVAKHRIEDLNIEDLERMKANWCDSNKEEIEKHISEAKRLVTESKNIVSDDSERESLIERIKNAESEIVKQNKILEKKEKLEEQKENESAGYPELLSDVKSIEREINSINDILENLDGDICYVCNSPLDSGEGLKYKQDQENKKKKLQIEYDNLYKKVTRQQNKIKEIEKGLFDLKCNSLDLKNSEVSKMTLQRKLDSIDLEIDKQIAICKEKAKNYLRRAKELQKETNPYTEQVKNAKIKKKDFEKTINNMEDIKKAIEADSNGLKFWVNGFGGQGLPSLLLDSVMTFLNRQMNYYLGKLTDGDITVDVTTQKELKSKKDLKDEINISVVIEGIPGATPSSGQKKKLNIASDLALMDLVATREDSSLDILLMDEVLDGLDSEGVSRVIELLSDLRKERSTILVITHEAGLTESFFDKIITITKEDGASSVKCSV